MTQAVAFDVYPEIVGGNVRPLLDALDAAIAEVQANAGHGDAEYNPWALRALSAAERLRELVRGSLVSLGSEECGERECPEYVTEDGDDTDVELCSHVELHLATTDDRLRLDRVRHYIAGVDPERNEPEVIAHALDMARRYACDPFPDF
jgi:hypothetical protein